jgi:membrane-associated phospholipid phosphatase
MSSLYKRPNLWKLLVFGVGGFFITALMASGESLIIGEERILLLINNLPNWLRIFFLQISFFGSAWILVIITFALLANGKVSIVKRVLASGISAYIFAIVAKEIITRPRPSELITVIQRELFVTGYGFPSGHTALATALAVTLGVYMPKKLRIMVPIWIGLVGLSRIYLGVHAPLDIIGGFCIGLVSACVVLLAFPPLNNTVRKSVAKKH